MTGRTMSDWIVELKSVDDNLARAFYTFKQEDYERLKGSGLPISADFALQSAEFNPTNENLMRFLDSYDGFTIRALPDKQGLELGLTRKYKNGVKSYAECQQFLKENIRTGQESLYSILLTEWAPTLAAGIIISNPEILLFDFAKGDVLPELSHGRIIPDFRGVFSANMRSMRYLGPKNKDASAPVEVRQQMWSILQDLRRGAGINFMLGYFEIVVTESGTRFVDYKLNEQYLKTSNP